MLKARDIMATDVPVISHTATVGEALRILKSNFGDESFLNAAPGLIIVNGRRELVGVFTPLIVITALLENAPAAATDVNSDDYFAAICEKIANIPVEAIMERQAISVTEDAILTDVAELFSKHRFQRVPVVRSKQVVGVIYRSRLLFAMTKSITGQG